MTPAGRGTSFNPRLGTTVWWCCYPTYRLESTWRGGRNDIRFRFCVFEVVRLKMLLHKTTISLFLNLRLSLDHNLVFSKWDYATSTIRFFLLPVLSARAHAFTYTNSWHHLSPLVILRPDLWGFYPHARPPPTSAPLPIPGGVSTHSQSACLSPADSADTATAVFT